MKLMTLSVPVGHVVGPGQLQQVGTVLVHGHVVGPFLVHGSTGAGGWTVTHIATGFSAHSFLPTRARAQWLANQLASLDCWDFSEPQDAKRIAPEKLSMIGALRAEAMHGDLRGR